MQAWERLGQMATERRLALGLRTRDQAAIALGVSVRLLSDFENGKRGTYEPFTLIRFEQGLGWLPGSIDTVLAGGYPSLLPGTVGAEIGPEEAELALIRRADIPDETKKAILAEAERLIERQRAERRAMVEGWLRIAEGLDEPDRNEK